MLMPRAQTLVQLTDELLARLDQRAVQQGRSRSDLIRAAIEAYMAADIEAELDRQIVEGYTRIPPEAWTQEWAESAGRELLEEESW